MVFIVKRVEYCRFDSYAVNWHMNTSTIMYVLHAALLASTLKMFAFVASVGV